MWPSVFVKMMIAIQGLVLDAVETERQMGLEKTGQFEVCLGQGCKITNCE